MHPTGLLDCDLTKEMYPEGTTIHFTVNDETQTIVGVIKSYNDQEGIVKISCDSAMSEILAFTIDSVHVRAHDKYTISQEKHPVGTRMVISTPELGTIAGFEVNVLEWKGSPPNSEILVHYTNALKPDTWCDVRDYIVLSVLTDKKRANQDDHPVGTRFIIKSSAPLAEPEEVVVMRWGNDVVPVDNPSKCSPRDDDEVRLYRPATKRDEWIKIENFEILENLPLQSLNPVNHPEGTIAVVGVNMDDRPQAISVEVKSYHGASVILGVPSRGHVSPEIRQFLGKGKRFSLNEAIFLKLVRGVPKKPHDEFKIDSIWKSQPASESVRFRPLPVDQRTVDLGSIEDILYHITQIKLIAERSGLKAEVTLS